MRKYFAAALLAILLCGCNNEVQPEIAKTESAAEMISEAAVTTAATEKDTTEKTEDTTVTTTVPTEKTTTEATTVTEPEPAQPEAILPAEAVKIDFGSIYNGIRYDSEYTILDGKNILVLYKFTDGEDVSAKASIFSTSDGTEMVNIDIPLTTADTFFIRDNAYFDDENILCKIYGCIWNDDHYIEKSCTTVYTDLTYESELQSLGGIRSWKSAAYKLPGGHRINGDDYGNIWDSESGDLLLNAVYRGPYSKGNMYYSYKFSIDENRFVYIMKGYEWLYGFGIYDFTTGTSRDVPDVADHTPMGYHDGKIYSYYNNDYTDGTDNILYVTDINTLETTPLHKFEFDEQDDTDIISNYNFIYDYKMSPDGRFLMNTEQSQDDISKIILYSTDTLDTVKEYEFKNIFIYVWDTQFTEDGKIVIEDYKHKCLYILDLNK